MAHRPICSAQPRAPFLLATSVSCFFLFSITAHAAGNVEFNRDIRPILSENCYQCHGPDKNKRKAKLRLDDRDSALAKKAIVPGRPAESELVARIHATEPTELMPPAETHKKLTIAQKKLLQQWIAEGAEYQAHWAFINPPRPDVPGVKQSKWIRNPIDAFILNNLESKGLSPSPAADRRTLLRRLSLDLIGLPPTPEEVRDFINDQDPSAYERAVDRLLESPHFGERMAVAWLDLVRFSDTVGYHGDQNQNIFPYRDYVIDSFNRNKRFDQFTIEQLAGDLLPRPTKEQLVATGFNRLNMMTREGGAQPKEYLAKYAADRVRTVAITWLGATMGCAECHDHKYDPFTTRDFYSLAAFFADVKQWGVYQDYGYTPNPDLKGWSNDHPFPPELDVDSPYLQRRLRRLDERTKQIFDEVRLQLRRDDEQRRRFDLWFCEIQKALASSPDGWIVPTVADPDKNDVVVQSDGSLLLTGKAKRKDAHVFSLEPLPGWLAAIRLEVLPHAQHKGKVTRDGSNNPLIQLSATVKKAQGGKETRLDFSFADADFKDARYANGAALLGVKDGWLTSASHAKELQSAVWRLDQPLQLALGDTLRITIRSDRVGSIRLAMSPLVTDAARPSADISAALKAVVACRNGDDALRHDRVPIWYFLSTGWNRGLFDKYKSLQQEMLECRDGRAWTLVTQSWQPLPTRVLPRGNWQDEGGALVEPAVPHFLPQPGNHDKRRLTRLDLAHWLVAPENPLTARVFMNRLWKQFFGAGISGVMEDVGAQGEWPAHPALLDWLAVEFRESGWNVKQMVTLIAMSATYRQDSRLRPDVRELDPGNRWLSSQSPRRLEAEFVRDNALAIAGLLNRDVGGPSVRPYQPAGYYVNLQFPDRDYVAHRDDRQYRRGVYMHWQRTFLHPMLANFDAPPREECTAGRTLANTPQQALTLLNDPMFVEAARVLAQHTIEKAPSDDGARLDFIYERALARPVRANERQSLLAFVRGQRSAFQSDPAAAQKLLHVGLAPVATGLNDKELAAWASVCRVILALHETITRY